MLEKEKRGIKIHLAALLGEMVQPLSAIVTPDNVHDSTQFDNLLEDVSNFEFLSDLILVMDKGYTNYIRYEQLDDRDIHFVVQLKKNASYTILDSMEYENYTDNVIRLEKNGLVLRLVEYDDGLKIWHFLTNIPSHEVSGHDIRDIYRIRWMIEIFFRKLKRIAKIEHLISESSNGVIIQIYSTLIAYTLINMFQIETGMEALTMEKIAKRIRHYLNTPIENTDFG